MYTVCCTLGTVLFICIVLELMRSNSAYFTRKTASCVSAQKTIVPTQLAPHRMYVKAIWGLSNRLRTFRKAYCVCRRTGRELVIVDGNIDAGGCDTHIERLVTFPGVQFVQENPTDVHTIYPNVACCFDGNVPDGTIFFDRICDLNPEGFDDTDDDTNMLYQIMKLSGEVESTIRETMDKIDKGPTIGLHIRQGSVSDWHFGNFFGAWKDDKLENPDMEPHFCCFANKNKNLSSCPGNETVIETFMDAMDLEPSDVRFFVASDRTGCTLYLHQHYPNRILTTGIKIHDSKPDTFYGFMDWYCLAMCDSLIVSQISSFSYEACMPKRLKSKSL